MWFGTHDGTHAIEYTVHNRWWWAWRTVPSNVDDSTCVIQRRHAWRVASSRARGVRTPQRSGWTHSIFLIGTQVRIVCTNQNTGHVRMMKLLVQRLHPTATLPCRATSGAAGFDLTCSETSVLGPKSRALVSTGIAVVIPEGHVGILKSRSSMAWRWAMDVEAGVIDSDYRGEIKVLLHNTSDSEHVLQPGERVAQMVILPVPDFDVVEESFLPSTSRGSSGFGSTGR